MHVQSRQKHLFLKFQLEKDKEVDIAIETLNSNIRDKRLRAGDLKKAAVDILPNMIHRIRTELASDMPLFKKRETIKSFSKVSVMYVSQLHVGLQNRSLVQFPVGLVFCPRMDDSHRNKIIPAPLLSIVLVMVLWESSQWHRKSILWSTGDITGIMSKSINPFPNKTLFLHVYSTSLLKTLCEMEKLIITSDFSISHSVFNPFIKFKIVFCKIFEFGRV